MFLKTMNRAMRYYRFWIYSCNIALLFATIIYMFAFIYVLNDTKMMLFPSIRLYQPTFLYSYCAIILQGGVLQAIGCFGAIRLNENLLNLYLFLMIALLFGDGIVGITWILRFNTIVAKLRGDLKLRLTNDYGMDPEFQEIWNSIQREYQCCGIDGPFDYNMTALIEQNYETIPGQLFPKSCCRESLPILPNEQIYTRDRCVTSYDPDLVYIYGCYDQIHHWLQHSADLLSILGFCVISFIKVCFLAILRYEIKEMIQKIKVLKGMTLSSSALPVHDLEAYLPRPSVVQTDASQSLLTGSAIPQSTYRTDKPCHHHQPHHHMCAAGACSARTSIPTATNNDLIQTESKKQSIV